MAMLHIDSLTKQPHRKALRLTLENLPPELDETYNDALARISGQDKEDTKIAHQVLSWITYATRPLTIKQLQHALSIEPEQTDLDDETLIDEELLISTCLGLITVDCTSEEVRLVHYTAQKYFEHRLLELMPDTHLRIASTCLTYMSFKTYQKIDQLTSDKEIKALGDHYPLLDYAGSNWGVHAQREDQKLVQQILRFLSPKATYLSSRLMIGGFKSLIQETSQKHWDYPVKYEARISGHNMAAYFGLQHTLMTLLSQATGVEDMINSTLLICSARGNQTLVQLLLDRGANINTLSWLGYTPLHLAAARGSLAMTKFQLGSNADVNIRHSSSSSTALHLAAENGYPDIIQALLEHGANVNIMRHDTDHASEFTALRLAVLMKDVASVNALLNSGADPNSLHLNRHWLFSPEETKMYEFRTTVLFDAVSQQQEAIVKLLLDRGADVNIGDATPLHRAVLEHNGRMVSLLIKNGADLRTAGNIKFPRHFVERRSIFTLFHEFSSEHFLGEALVAVAGTPQPGSVAEILINSGADINHVSMVKGLQDLLCSEAYDSYETAIIRLPGSVNSVQPLLNIPLLAASRNGNESLVRVLLDRGAKMWGGEKESWLQQAIFAKPITMELEEGSYPKGDCSRDFILAIYRNIIDNEILETLREGVYMRDGFRTTTLKIRYGLLEIVLQKEDSLSGCEDSQWK